MVTKIERDPGDKLSLPLGSDLGMQSGKFWIWVNSHESSVVPNDMYFNYLRHSIRISIWIPPVQLLVKIKIHSLDVYILYYITCA